jgi:hypothetical protein
MGCGDHTVPAGQKSPAPRLLRRRSQRPCDTRAQKRDELAPPHRLPRAETLSCLLRLALFSPCAGNRIAANIAKLPELLRKP